MEVTSAARWEALQDQTINGYVAGKVFRHRLEEKIDGTGGLALVVYRDGGWATPDRVNTLSYPVLVFDCYADPTRNEMGGEVRSDAEDKAWALRNAVERRFHARAEEWWGARGSNPGLRVVSCRRFAEPDIISGLATLGDVVVVRQRYAVEV